MSGRLLDKYVNRQSTSGDGGHEELEAEDCGSFGWLRGIRDRAVMLELRKKDGHILAVGYAWIERIEFMPEDGIVLHLPGRTIKIQGSGLNIGEPGSARLFEGLTRHRVPWVRESDRSESIISGLNAVLVELISWDA